MGDRETVRRVTERQGASEKGDRETGRPKTRRRKTGTEMRDKVTVSETGDGETGGRVKGSQGDRVG